MTHDTVTISPGSRFRAAMVLAIVADALQIVVFPLFIEGALSPTDDVLDLAVAAVLVNLLGWHWEFLPALFLAVVEDTEEAVHNSLLRATTVTGRGHPVEALPIETTTETLKKYGAIK